MIRQVSYTEEEHVAKQFQGHAGDLSCVFDTIQFRATTDHSVRIANCLDLENNIIGLVKDLPGPCL